jgi:hypothetical protein
VGRYQGRADPAILPAGSVEGGGWSGIPNPAIGADGSVAGRRSHCEAHWEVIRVAVEQGLNAQPMYQDLVFECFSAGIH